MEFWKIFATAVLTASATNIFGYFKEKKFASSKYAEQVLKELYVPIYKILTKSIIPGNGYEGINRGQLEEIKEIIEKHPELTDPRLDSIIYRYLEDIYFEYNQTGDYPERYRTYDLDRKLFEYILISFNQTRRYLGLPSDLKYAYPILFKFRVWKDKKSNQRIQRKIRKIRKKEANGDRHHVPED